MPRVAIATRADPRHTVPVAPESVTAHPEASATGLARIVAGAVASRNAP